VAHRVRGPLTASSSELAALFDVHENTVGLWIKAGLPVTRAKRGGANKIDVGVAIRWVKERDAAEHEAALERARDNDQLDALRARKLEAESRIAEAEADLVEGKQVVAADVEGRLSRVVLAIREGVLSLPSRAVQSGLVATEKEDGLSDLARDVLTELARLDP
jgi:phage terminase Nu1 subunit (DNA packaging protein)